VRTPRQIALRTVSPRPPPRQGEHTREVLAEYGFSDAEIAAVG
jgi:crotonobetainyl-CoA:carnitine CoA-transferase CaiB-like acyl-CoA transferase